MRVCGEQMENHVVVAKVLRSLTSKFNHVVATIQESKDLSHLTLDELSGSLQGHKARINRYV